MGDCNSCGRGLALPTVHFMCKHTFCEPCVDDVNGIRRCPICSKGKFSISEYADKRNLFLDFDTLKKESAKFAANKHNSSTYFKELDGVQRNRAEIDGQEIG